MSEDTVLETITEKAVREQGFRRFTLGEKEFFVAETREGIKLCYREGSKFRPIKLSPLSYEKPEELEQDCIRMGIAPVTDENSLRDNGFKPFVGYDRQDENKIVGGYLINIVDDCLLFFKPDGDNYAIHAKIPMNDDNREKLKEYLR